jgi:hypothetical protein
MKIELKNIKINLTFSEETTMFMADVYVNGKKTAYANNDGRGGCTFYNSYHAPNNDEDLRQAEAFCKALPKVRVEEYDFEYDMNLEHFIDNLIEDELKKKEQKKLEKKMLDTIMWGKPNGHSYTQVKFKVPLAKVPTTRLQEIVDKYKKEFKSGDKFLNTNLEGLGIKL